MRIDSIKYIGAEKIYYPFKTARVSIDSVWQYADTLGGSWWGSMIIEDTLTGITAIPTRYGDTVWIHTRAHLNDQWTFYRDIAVRYYEAKIIALDTATITGIFDSVKVIRIIAKDSNAIAFSDSLNGLELVVGQHHGLLQVIGFYLFPYRQFEYNPDYYLSYMSGFANFSHSALTFKRVSFHYPTNELVFDFDIGDVFSDLSIMAPQIRAYSTYKIIDTSSTDSTFLYQVHYHLDEISGPYSNSSDGLDTLTYKFGEIVDVNKMPEEWYNEKIIHYKYRDSSFCVQSPVYMLDESLIHDDGHYYTFEQGRYNQVFKERLGNISYDIVDGSGGTGSGAEITYGLSSAKKDGIACSGGNVVLGLGKALAENKNILVYPNPANNTVTVSSKSDKVFSVQILDLTGRLLIQQSSQQERLSIPIENLPNGLYLLKISSGNEMLTKKLSVLH